MAKIRRVVQLDNSIEGEFFRVAWPVIESRKEISLLRSHGTVLESLPLHSLPRASHGLFCTVTNVVFLHSGYATHMVITSSQIIDPPISGCRIIWNINQLSPSLHCLSATSSLHLLSGVSASELCVFHMLLLCIIPVQVHHTRSPCRAISYAHGDSAVKGKLIHNSILPLFTKKVSHGYNVPHCWSENLSNGLRLATQFTQQLSKYVATIFDSCFNLSKKTISHSKYRKKKFCNKVIQSTSKDWKQKVISSTSLNCH